MSDDRHRDVLERETRYDTSDGGDPVGEELSELAAEELEQEEQDIQERGAALLGDRRRVIGLLAAVVLLIVAIYVILPKVVGIGDSIDRASDATWYWVVIGIAFNVLSFISYTAVFRGVMAGRDPNDPVHKRLDLKASYEITMSGFVATILFSAAGAGGVALTYWAVRKAGMERRRAACRLVAFTVLHYSLYAFALVIFGVLLRTGVLPGDNPAGGTIVPAIFAGVLLVLAALISTVPEDAERRIRSLGKRGARWAKIAGAIVRVPATLASGVRTAIDYMRHPKRQAQAILGGLGWWAGNIGTLWACFEAFGVGVPFGVMVMGYFVGMIANLAPSPAGGVGTVDAGLIGAFVLFGIPIEDVIPAVLLFRVVGFWLPIPFGVHAYVKLRKTVQRWSNEMSGATIQSKVTASAEAT
jgi:uncharacterized protein (TIRG00374 family)